MSKVSFVVPIFNIEKKALQRSIESICGQTHQDIEVILVDDGSVNDALEICNNAAKNDTRIHVIHQENQGVSVARNVGIQKATGDYLAFVDPDDYIDERFAENALSIAKDTNAQIVICQFRIIGEAMDGLNTMQVQEIQTAQVTELQSDVMTQHFDSYSIGSCWGKLFDVNFLKRKQLEFVPGMKKSQDRVFVFDCYGAAEKNREVRILRLFL